MSDDGTSGWTDLGGGSLTGITYSHTGLAAGTTKHYRVRAHNSAGPGAWSAVDSATTAAAAVTVPDAPTGLSATPGDEQVTLSWTAPANDGGAAIMRYGYDAHSKENLC